MGVFDEQSGPLEALRKHLETPHQRVTGRVGGAGSNQGVPASGSVGSGSVGIDTQSQSFSDPGTSTGAGNHRLYFKDVATITGVSASLGTAPTGGPYEVDVHKNGTTIFTTQTNRPIITAGTFYDEATLEVVSIAAGDYLTVDIDLVGATITGEFLTVNIEWRV